MASLTKEKEMAVRPKVMIMRCAGYEPDKICAIVKDGMEELDSGPRAGIS